MHFEFLPSTKVQHLWVQAPPKEVFSFWNLILNRLFYVFQYIWNNLWYSWNYLYILATSVRQILQKVLWSWKVKIQNARLLWWTHLVTLWSFSSDTNSFVLHFLKKMNVFTSWANAQNEVLKMVEAVILSENSTVHFFHLKCLFTLYL